MKKCCLRSNFIFNTSKLFIFLSNVNGIFPVIITDFFLYVTDRLIQYIYLL